MLDKTDLKWISDTVFEAEERTRAYVRDMIQESEERTRAYVRDMIQESEEHTRLYVREMIQESEERTRAYVRDMIQESEERTNARFEKIEGELRELRLHIENNIWPALQEVLGFLRNIADVSNTAQKVDQHDEDIRLISTAVAYHDSKLNNHELRICEIESKYQ